MEEAVRSVRGCYSNPVNFKGAWPQLLGCVRTVTWQATWGAPNRITEVTRQAESRPQTSVDGRIPEVRV